MRRDAGLPVQPAGAGCGIRAAVGREAAARATGPTAEECLGRIVDLEAAARTITLVTALAYWSPDHLAEQRLYGTAGLRPGGHRRRKGTPASPNDGTSFPFFQLRSSAEAVEHLHCGAQFLLSD